MGDRDFPPDFLWGSVTSGYVVEGGNDRADWYTWERTPGAPVAEVCGIGIDHYHRFEDDFALLASLGQNAHRFSLEWSRIEPAAGEFDEAELAHYEAVLTSLHRHGMTPFVTLYHFVLPQWFADRGGWLADDALDLFERFVTVVGRRLGSLMPFVCTVNEPQVLAWGCYHTGHGPPGHTDFHEAKRVNEVLAAAHRRGVRALRATAPHAQVGVCLALPVFEPLRADDPADVEATRKKEEFWFGAHLDDLSRGGDPGDWVGVQYYSRYLQDASQWPGSAAVPEGVPTTQMGWVVYPEGLSLVVKQAADTGLPVYVTENGIATTDDDERVRFLGSHLREVADLLAAGVDVRGYLHFAAFDTFEWGHGYGPTFGLIGIDRDDDLRRVVRPSAQAYGRVIRSGRLEALVAGDP